MPFFPNSSEESKINARNIKYMDVLIFQQFFNFDQVSADSEMSILGQAPRYFRPKAQNTPENGHRQGIF